MPHPSFVQARKDQLAAAGITSPRLMPQVFASKEDQSGTQEDRRRRSEEAAKVTASVPSLGGSIPPAQPAPVQTPPTPAIPTVIDRWHKEVGSQYGGRVMVDLAHDPSETDQIPPLNAGYTTTIQAGINKAVTILGLVKGDARVAVIIGAGTYIEDIVLQHSGIDFFGLGQPRLYGKAQLLPAIPTPSRPLPTLPDGQFHDIDFIAADPKVGAFLPIAFPPDNGTPLGFWNCRFYSDGIGAYFQRRIYMENCHFWQTSNVYGFDEQYVPLIVEMLPPQFGGSVLKDCSVHSWLNPPSTLNGPLGSFDLDNSPGGFAIKAICTAQGTFATNEAMGTMTFEWPANQLTLIDCDIYGALLADQWRVEHIGGNVHFGQVSISTGGYGGAYAYVRGRPLFDPTNGYYADVLGHVSFSGTNIYAREIAAMIPYTGLYPVGVTPSDYPGMGFCEVSGVSHYCAWNAAPGNAFGGIGGVGRVQVANSSTAGSVWGGLPWTVTTYGACPTGCLSNRRFFLI